MHGGAAKKRDEEIRKMMGFFFGGWVREVSKAEGTHLALSMFNSFFIGQFGFGSDKFCDVWERRDLIRTTNKIGIKTYMLEYPRLKLNYGRKEFLRFPLSLYLWFFLGWVRMALLLLLRKGVFRPSVHLEAKGR